MLENKVALVTGGNSGIGREIALSFSKAGAQVFIFANNQDRGEAVVRTLCENNPHKQAAFYKVDVSKTQDVQRAVDAILSQHAPVDILVNSAGVTRDNLFLKMSETQWDTVIDTNLKSVFNTSKALARSMMKQRKGKIINISSVIGLTGNPGQMNYAASKSGMIGLSKSLAKELAGRNICVNCIAPGFIETPMTEKLTELQRQEILKKIPLKRLGTASDIANLALFLASDQANYITGQVFTVDGGMVM